jgi:hypothetical protein
MSNTGTHTWRTVKRSIGGAAVVGILVVVAAAGVLVTGPAAAQSTPTDPVSAFGDATHDGSPPGSQLNAPVVSMTSTRAGNGYWLLGADGGVFNYGGAGFYGSEAGSGVQTPFVGMAPTPDGHGYWLAGDFGNVYNFGDATSESVGGVSSNAPVVGIAAEPAGMGYWLVAADGGVFSFGDAAFYGSMGGTSLNAPVVAMAATPDGHGYWLVAADGGVFSFGDAGFYGSMGGKQLNAPVVGITAEPDGHGYWLVAADGGVFSFGDAAFYGSIGGALPGNGIPAVAMAATADGHGYWLATTDKSLPPPTSVPSVLNECNMPTASTSVEPSAIVLACGDGNASLTYLSWSSWTPTIAVATGYYTHNTCTPDCANGTFVSALASVRLGYPVETSAGREFAMISYTYVNPGAPGGWSTVTGVAQTSPG